MPYCQEYVVSSPLGYTPPGQARNGRADGQRVGVVVAGADGGAADAGRAVGDRARDRPDAGGAVVARAGVADVGDRGGAAAGRAGDGIVQHRAVAVGPLRARAVDCGDRLVRGDQWTREAGPAHLDPAAVARVIDGQAGVRIGVGGQVRPRASRASGVGLIRRLGHVQIAARGAAPATAERPRGFAVATQARARGGGRQAGPAGRGDTRHRRRVVVEPGAGIAVVAGGRDHGLSRVRARAERHGARTAPAVRDLVGAEALGGGDGRVQVGVEVAVGLDQDDVTVRAQRRDRVEVEALLFLPSEIARRQRCRPARSR